MCWSRQFRELRLEDALRASQWIGSRDVVIPSSGPASDSIGVFGGFEVSRTVASVVLSDQNRRQCYDHYRIYGLHTLHCHKNQTNGRGHTWTYLMY
jgi:hypothetical protein